LSNHESKPKALQERVADEVHQRALRGQMTLNPGQFYVGGDGRVYPKPEKTPQEHHGEGFSGRAYERQGESPTKNPEPPDALGSLVNY